MELEIFDYEIGRDDAGDYVIVNGLRTSGMVDGHRPESPVRRSFQAAGENRRPVAAL